MTTSEPHRIDPSERYSYRVVWSPDDRAFRGTVDELPSLSWLAGEQVAALAGIRNRAREIVAVQNAIGEIVPRAFGEIVPRALGGTALHPDAAVPIWVPSEIYAGLLRAAVAQDIDVRWLAHSRLAGNREVVPA